MGIPENHAKHALYNTGNNDANMACGWYFENLENPKLNEPLLVKKKGDSSGDGGSNIPREIIDNMTMMGFTEKQVLKALKNCDNNPDRAMEWIFSHMDDPESDNEMTDVNVEQNDYKNDLPGNYTLNSFITHLGSSTHAGHYVCHVRRDNEWVYFNDSKVAITNNPPIGKGYMYFFRKI